jgi:hypothetical protein
MCNVLHEIEPSEWLQFFAEHGAVRSLLRNDGFLLLVEDMRVPVGERAHAGGFLVLDTPELYKLYGFGPSEPGFALSDARGDGRLKAHLLPGVLLGRASKDTYRAALLQIRETALREIARLRQSSSTDYGAGRLHGFWVQQLANADLALA